jgi:hypothetical protein
MPLMGVDTPPDWSDPPMVTVSRAFGVISLALVPLFTPLTKAARALADVNTPHACCQTLASIEPAVDAASKPASKLVVVRATMQARSTLPAG